MKDYEDGLLSAKIVQEGLLPKKRHFERLFDDYFTIYLPQHIVSGDFYWLGKKHNMRYLVVGDCTGHGVSAALLSVLGLNLFEYAVMNKGIKKTNKILKEVDKKFIESFKSSNQTTFDNPWIDLTIICIEDEKQQIHFSSADRKLLLVKASGESEIFKGSSYPVGGWKIEKNRSFKSTTFHFDKGDQIYLGSDGFQDQIGGKLGKKYKSKKLHDFLSHHSKNTMSTQKEMLLSELKNWQGNQEQTDDVCLVGIKL